MARTALRRLLMGLSTVSGLANRGFFIPYRYADDLAASGADCFPGVQARLDEHKERFRSVLEHMDSLTDDLLAIGGLPPPEPRWTQDWFPGLDAAVAYCMVRVHQPTRIVEVGSGHSTRFFARAVRDGGLSTDITAIDPAPRADLANVGVSAVRKTVQAAGDEPFRMLQNGDVLSIDSSHILMPGSDVDVLFNRIFPLLPGGVLIHVHDMFLPDGYPQEWHWRGYNEQLAVAMLLEDSSTDVLWASHYVRTRMQDDVNNSIAGRIEMPSGAIESSLWFRKSGY